MSVRKPKTELARARQLIVEAWDIMAPGDSRAELINREDAENDTLCADIWAHDVLDYFGVEDREALKRFAEFGR